VAHLDHLPVLPIGRAVAVAHDIGVGLSADVFAVMRAEGLLGHGVLFVCVYVYMYVYHIIL